MTLDDSPPARRRSTIARNTGLANSVPVAHVSLGRAWQHRNKPDPGRLHIVVQHDGEWLVLCTGSRATRSFKGKPSQAQCGDCRTAFRTNSVPPGIETVPLPPMTPESADSHVRRCWYCGEWAWATDDCGTCHATAARHAAARAAS
jgi:hypothetical protein